MADISEQWTGGGDGTNYSGRHQHPVKLKQDKRLREWCFGSREGISNRDFTQDSPGAGDGNRNERVESASARNS